MIILLHNLLIQLFYWNDKSVLNPYTKNVSNEKQYNSNYKTNISILSSNVSNNTTTTTTNEKEVEKQQLEDGEEYDERKRVKLEQIRKFFLQVRI